MTETEDEIERIISKEIEESLARWN